MPGLKKKKSKVNFKEDLIEGVSQPMTIDQHWTLFYFENHAHACPHCVNPYKAFQKEQKLCREGAEKAFKITELLLQLKKDGNVYCHNREEHQYVRIEVPKAYTNCLQLLRGIRNYGDDLLEESMDRTYHVPPRVDKYAYEVRESSAPVSDYEDKPSPRRTKSKRKHSKRPGRKSYGSLQQLDLEEEEQNERRESTFSYNETYSYTPDWYQERYYSYPQDFLR